MHKHLQWLWFILAVVAVIEFMIMFRYEPIPTPESSIGNVVVWDRFKQRLCMVSVALHNRPLCSLDEIQNATK